MKKHLLVFFVILSAPLATWAGEVVDISVSGLACPFCAYSLEKNLRKLPAVDCVTVDLAQHTARIVINAGHNADLAAIKQAIVNAGFTPGSASRSVTEKPCDQR